MSVSRILAEISGSRSARAEEQYQTKIAKLETQMGRVSIDLVKIQRKTRTGSPTEEGYAR